MEASLMNGEKNSNIELDTESIPNFVAEELAAVTLECVRNYLHRQEGIDSTDGEELEIKKGGQSNQ